MLTNKTDLEKFREATKDVVIETLLRNGRRIRESHPEDLLEGSFVYDRKGESVIPKKPAG